MRFGTKIILSAFLFILFLWFFKRLFPFFLPFLLGWGLAAAAEPGVRLLNGRLRFPRWLSAGIMVSCTFFLITALLTCLLALLIGGLSRLGSVALDLTEAAASGIHILEVWLLDLTGKAPGPLRPLLQDQIRDLFSDGTAFLDQGIKYILSLAGGILTHIPDQALTLFTAIVSGFMISAKLPALRRRLKDLLSQPKIRALLSFLRKLRHTAGHWLLAQLKLAGVTALILTSGLILLKIPYAPIWALGISLLDALPLFGTGALLIPWSVIAFLQENSVKALGLLALYVTAALTRSMLEPRFVGRQLGMDPLVTLAAIYAGYRLWGFGGMILSPLLAVTLLGLIQAPSDSGKNC